MKPIFLSLLAADLAVARVAARAAQGGHNVPEEAVRRRFDAGLRDFQDLDRTLVNTWVVYENSGPTPVPIASGDNE